MLVAVSQRVDPHAPHGERRDVLDQRWVPLLAAAGLTPVPVPNTIADAPAWLDDVGVGGVVLTGGNDPVALGGDAPERDAVEGDAIEWALAGHRPLLGVCRGMQMIQSHTGVEIHAVDGHVATTHDLDVGGVRRTVNSFHNWGATSTVDELAVCARADDGVIEAVRLTGTRVAGVMWHPERCDPFDPADIAFLAAHFGGRS